MNTGVLSPSLLPTGDQRSREKTVALPETTEGLLAVEMGGRL